MSVVSAQQVGTPAPQFSHITLDHGQISLSDYLGKNVYLFFFGWA
jgi:peroxiredoxin